MPTRQFHPAVRHWFESTFAGPTAAQEEAWTHILAGHDTLISAPTGSGKTLAAFLTAIHHLVEEAISGSLQDETRVVYVSPLKALSNDIQKNLEAPLAGVLEQLAIEGCLAPPFEPRLERATRLQANALRWAKRRRISSSQRPNHFTSS